MNGFDSRGPDWLSVQEAKREFPELWEHLQKHLPISDEETISKCLSIAVDLCPGCYTDYKGCQCENDE